MHVPRPGGRPQTPCCAACVLLFVQAAVYRWARAAACSPRVGESDERAMDVRAMVGVRGGRAQNDIVMGLSMAALQHGLSHGLSRGLYIPPVPGSMWGLWSADQLE